MKLFLLRQSWRNLFATKAASCILLLTLGLTCFMLVLIWRSGPDCYCDAATAGSKAAPGLQTRTLNNQFPVGFSIIYRSGNLRPSVLPETHIATGCDRDVKGTVFTRFTKRLLKVNGTLLAHLPGSITGLFADDEQVLP